MIIVRPAARLAHDGPVGDVQERPVVAVHPGHDLVTQIEWIRPVAGESRTRCRRTWSTRGRRPRSPAAPARPRTPRPPPFGKGARRRPVAPHGDEPGQALDHVHGGIPADRVVVRSPAAGRRATTIMRVAERVPAQQLAADDVLVDTAGGSADRAARHAPSRRETNASAYGGEARPGLRESAAAARARRIEKTVSRSPCSQMSNRGRLRVRARRSRGPPGRLADVGAAPIGRVGGRVRPKYILVTTRSSRPRRTPRRPDAAPRCHRREPAAGRA